MSHIPNAVALDLARERSFLSQQCAALTSLAEISLAAGDVAAMIKYATDAKTIHKITGADILLTREMALISRIRHGECRVWPRTTG